MKKLRVALIASLLVNIFLAAALVAGTAWLRVRHPGMIAAGSLRLAGAELPVDQRRAFRAALRDTRHAMAGTIEQGRAARMQAATLLRQPVIDQPALLAALAQARTADGAVRAAVEARAVAFAATLPADQRAKIADAMESRGGARFGR